MAKVRNMDESVWREWVEGRPPVVKAICERLPADRLYVLSPTGQRVTIEAYAEDGTLRVYVDPDYNELWRITGHQVIGINPDDLRECDIPMDELVGPWQRTEVWIDSGQKQ